MPAKRTPKTWAEVAFVNAGWRDGMKALEFAMDWGMATAMLGHEPESIEEFAEAAEHSRATAFRMQQAFRKAFPTLDGPNDLNRRAGMMPVYDELRTLAKDPVQVRPFVLAQIFTLGAKRAKL